MSFLALNIEKMYLMTQKSELEFEQVCLTNQVNDTTEELEDYLSDNEIDDYSDDDYATYLHEQETYLTTQNESVGSQLTAINNQVDNYDKTITANIKSECTLNFSA